MGSFKRKAEKLLPSKPVEKFASSHGILQTHAHAHAQAQAHANASHGTLMNFDERCWATVDPLTCNKFRTQEAHEFPALDGERLRHDQDTFVATLCTKHSQTNTCRLSEHLGACWNCETIYSMNLHDLKYAWATLSWEPNANLAFGNPFGNPNQSREMLRAFVLNHACVAAGSLNERIAWFQSSFLLCLVTSRCLANSLNSMILCRSLNHFKHFAHQNRVNPWILPAQRSQLPVYPAWWSWSGTYWIHMSEDVICLPAYLPIYLFYSIPFHSILFYSILLSTYIILYTYISIVYIIHIHTHNHTHLSFFNIIYMCTYVYIYIYICYIYCGCAPFVSVTELGSAWTVWSTEVNGLAIKLHLQQFSRWCCHHLSPTDRFSDFSALLSTQLLDTTERVEILELHVDGAAFGRHLIVELHARSVPNLSESELKEVSRLEGRWREGLYKIS